MKYPKYILRDEYIGTFSRVDSNGIPVYRFSGIESIADEYELTRGSDCKQELEERIKRKLRYKELFEDKKRNVSYWDEITCATENFVEKIISLGFMENFDSSNSSLNDEDVLIIGKEVSSFLIEKLEKEYYMSFPYNDSNY